jgi:hypothetical protein
VVRMLCRQMLLKHRALRKRLVTNIAKPLSFMHLSFMFEPFMATIKEIIRLLANLICADIWAEILENVPPRVQHMLTLVVGVQFRIGYPTPKTADFQLQSWSDSKDIQKRSHSRHCPRPAEVVHRESPSLRQTTHKRFGKHLFQTVYPD